MASVEVIEMGMLCTLAVPAIKANLHSQLAPFCRAMMAVFLVDDFTKKNNSLFVNFILNLELILVNPKVTKIDLIVSSHKKASLNTPTNHTIIITQDNTIKHAR